MGLSKDIAGVKFGMLTAIRINGKQKREMMWLCYCECGGHANVRLSNLTNKNTRSCGCLKKK